MDFIGEAFESRFETAMSNKEYDLNDVEAVRDYVNSLLEFVGFSHKLYMQIENANRMDED
jgi:hypothetical protein